MNVTELDLLAHATEFSFPKDVDRRSDSEPIILSYRGNEKWAICRGHWEPSEVWTRKERWETEPMSSNRTDAFLKRARWSLKEALEQVEKAHATL